MASPLPPSLNNTLEYFDKYQYPLTAEELWYWQHESQISLSKIKKVYHKSLSRLRKQRLKYSQAKWQLAREAGQKLKRFPTVAAVFVTGALAMNNCPADDDIDLMVVTYPNCLWFTRFFVNLYLHTRRRFPGDKHAPDKVCPNLWLDTNNLKIYTHDLYQAHEILQAKLLWERTNVQYRFLVQNSWVQKYLPIAYKDLAHTSLGLRATPSYVGGGWGWYWSLNLLFFFIQYLYMRPKMTREKVGLGFAFFHPAK